jgi:hypothetical protein
VNVTCDIFDFQVAAESATLIAWSLTTDLPPGTAVNVAAERRYLNRDGLIELWEIAGFSVQIEPLPNGLSGAAGAIDVAAGDRTAFVAYRRRSRSAASRMTTAPSNDVEVYCVVPEGQRIREFGPRNQHLHGKAVIRAGTACLVDDGKWVLVAMSPEIRLPPSLAPYSPRPIGSLPDHAKPH